VSHDEGDEHATRSPKSLSMRLKSEPQRSRQSSKQRSSAEEIAGDPSVVFGSVCALAWQQGAVNIRILFAVDISGFNFYLAGAVASAPKVMSNLVAGPNHALCAKLEQQGPTQAAEAALAEQLCVPIAQAPPTMQPHSPFSEQPKGVREESGSTGESRYRRWYLLLQQGELCAAHGVERDRKERRWEYYVALRSLVGLQQQHGVSWQLNCRRAKDVKAMLHAIVYKSESGAETLGTTGGSSSDGQRSFRNPLAAAAAQAAGAASARGSAQSHHSIQPEFDVDATKLSDTLADHRQQGATRDEQSANQVDVLPPLAGWQTPNLPGSEPPELDLSDLSQQIATPEELLPQQFAQQDPDMPRPSTGERMVQSADVAPVKQSGSAESPDMDLEEAERLLGNSSLLRWMAEAPPQDDVERLSKLNAELGCCVSKTPPMPLLDDASVPHITPERAMQLLEQIKDEESGVGLRALLESGVWHQVARLRQINHAHLRALSDELFRNWSMRTHTVCSKLGIKQAEAVIRKTKHKRQGHSIDLAVHNGE